MTEPPPWPPDDRTTESRPSWRGQQVAQVKLLLGLGTGVAVSLLVWHYKVRPVPEKSIMTTIFVVLALKIGVSVVLMFFPAWRTFAAGMITSIAIGILIFFFTCGGTW
jgi:fatty acid desaturase